MNAPRLYICTADLVGACPQQVELFVRTFKSGRAKINARNMAKARLAGLDTLWLEWLLSKRSRAEVCRDMELAWDGYCRALTLARNKCIAGAMTETERCRASWKAFANHERARDAALISALTGGAK